MKSNGHLYIGMDIDKVLDMGVQKLEDSLIVNMVSGPIVTYSAENAYAFDIGTQNELSIHITRRNPQNAYDPLDDTDLEYTLGDDEDVEDAADRTLLEGSWEHSGTWCNRLWKKALTSLINRWQARTDGNRLTFIPVVTIDGTADTDGVFQRKIVDANVYMKTLSISYSINSPEVLEVSINLVRGSMCGQRIGRSS